MSSQQHSEPRLAHRKRYIALTWTTLIVGLLFVVFVVERGLDNGGAVEQIGAAATSPTPLIPTATAQAPQAASAPTQTPAIPEGWKLAVNGMCDPSLISVSTSSTITQYWPSSKLYSARVADYCTSAAYLGALPATSLNPFDPSNSCGRYPNECVSSTGGPCDYLEGGCIPYYAADISMRCNTSFECVDPPNMNQDPWASNEDSASSDPFADTTLGRPIDDDSYGEPSNNGPWWQNDTSCVSGFSPSYQC